MKFLVILLLYVCKCFGDYNGTDGNTKLTEPRLTPESIPAPDNEVATSSSTATTISNNLLTPPPVVTVTEHPHIESINRRLSSTPISHDSKPGSSTATTISNNLLTPPPVVTLTEHPHNEESNEHRLKSTPLSQDSKPDERCEVTPNFDPTTAQSLCPPPPGGMCMPKFAMYLIASSMLLMFLIIIYLVYALQKAKGSGYKYIANETNPTVNTGGGYNRQISQEPTTPIIMPLDSITIDDLYFKHTSSVRDVSRNTTTPTSSGRRESKVIRIIKNSNPQTNIILREQIKEICQGVLNNPITLKSRVPKDFLLDVEGLERRPTHKRLTREKSASTPQLDIYDTIPAMHPKDSLSSIGKNKSSRELKLTNVASKDTADKTERDVHEDNDENPIYDNPPVKPQPHDIDDIPVYNSLPSQPPEITVNGFESDNRPHSKKITVVEDTGYLLVLHSDSDASNLQEKTEPSYINAKKNDCNF